MSEFLPLPNLLAAFVARSRQLSDITNLVGNQITAGRIRTYDAKTDPQGWHMPSRALVFRGVPGPVWRPYRIPVRGQPVQVECYGTDLRTADELWRTWFSNFFPSQLNIASGFVIQNLGVAVISMEEMGAPVPLYESESAWPRTITTIFTRYSEVPSNVVVGSADIGAQTG